MVVYEPSSSTVKPVGEYPVYGNPMYKIENPKYVDPNTSVTAKLTFPTPKPETITEEANRLVSGDRNQDYGEPLDECSAIADMWNTYLRFKYDAKPNILPEDVAQMMVMMKITREANRHKRDNLVDIAGYAQVADRIITEREKRQARTTVFSDKI